MSERKLKDYQSYGVQWLQSNYSSNHGSILSDEMGLGKTFQVVKFLEEISTDKTRFNVLVLCPLSVVQTWVDEMSFCTALNNVILVLRGDKEIREEMYRSAKWNNSFVCVVTNYETVLHDSEKFAKKKWNVLVVDEAHRLKNSDSILHNIVVGDLQYQHCVLLTGTPIQNNLRELYSLLTIVDRNKFPSNSGAQFEENYRIKTSSENNDLQNLLKSYVLRRTKEDVSIKLPPKSDLIIYHGLTSLQKKLYKSLLMKDNDLLVSLAASSQSVTNKRTSLNNILIQLRKCCLHPYLFQGVEPEPFMIGDHIFLASQKMVLLDSLLEHLKLKKHKVLIFSQFTSMLDIIQDYLEYKRFSYERLDGSCRSEERFMSIKNFNQLDSTFIFLLSTKAGGQGITLTSADTVIFTDCDFNPQNDLQAAARSHRIGQEKPVKIVKLVCRNSVEEIILARSQNKLKLSSDILDTGHLQGELNIEIGSASEIKEDIDTSSLSGIVKFGLENILNDIESSDDLNIDFDQILGSTDKNGCWSTELNNSNDSTSNMVTKSCDEDVPESMYDFEGENYKMKLKQSEEVLSKLVEEMPKELTVATGRGTKRTLTHEEVELRNQQRQELEAKKAKLIEERRIEREEMRKSRLEKLWSDNGYVSLKLHSQNKIVPSYNEFSDEVPSYPLDESVSIQYVSGDVTKPVRTKKATIPVIIHCVDNSGKWGEGGLFSALDKVSKSVSEKYELACSMKDLAFGDVHLVSISEENAHEEMIVALIVAQKRSSKGSLSEIDVKVLDSSFRELSQFASTQFAANGKPISIHSPRLGYSMKTFNWYCAERLMRKHFIANGIHTLVYYFSKSRSRQQPANVASYTKDRYETQNIGSPVKDNEPVCSNDGDQNDATNVSNYNHEHVHKFGSELPSVFSGLSFYFSPHIQKELSEQLGRYIIAYDGEIVDEAKRENCDYIYIYEEEENAQSTSTYKILSVQYLTKCIQDKVKPII